MSRGMIPEDLFRIQWGFDARLSPYGRLVACTVTRIRRINGLLRRPLAAPSPVPPPAVTSCPRPLWRPQHTTAGLPRRPAARWIAVWTRISAWARVAPQGCPEATAAGRALRGGISNAHRSERHLLLLGMG